MGYTSLLSYFCCFASGESFLKEFFSAAFSMDCSVLLVSSFILSYLFNRIVSKRKCIRNHWKQQTDEIKNVLSVLMKCFFQGKLISFLRQVKAFLSVVFYLHRLWS